MIGLMQSSSFERRDYLDDIRAGQAVRRAERQRLITLSDQDQPSPGKQLSGPDNGSLFHGLPSIVPNGA